jgi:hypothetical protein
VFGAPDAASDTFAQPGGGVVDVTIEPLSAGSVDVHVYVVASDGRLVDPRGLRVVARPEGQGAVPFALLDAGPGHRTGSADLDAGEHRISIAGIDAGGRPLRGEMTVEIR